MKYSLRTGKVIDITFEQWLNMTPEDEEYLIAFGHGEEVNNPWSGSVLEDVDTQDVDAYLKELPDILPGEKLCDEDFNTDA